MNTGMKVFLACALGATVGTYVAIEVTPVLWWIGLVVGGLVGYLSYEFNKVVAAVPRAWSAATSWKPNWRVIFPYFKAWAVATGFCINTLLFFVFFVECVAYSEAGWTGVAMLIQPGVPARITIAVVAFSMALGLLLAIAVPRVVIKTLEGIYCIPVVFWMWVIPYCAFWGTLWCVKHIPWMAERLCAGIAVLLRFGVTLFRLTHSEMRLLCFVDAAIGVAIGHYFGSAIVGGLAGGLWGALNFEIFSIRVLKLVPASSSIFSR